MRTNLKKSAYISKSLKYILRIPTTLIKDHLVKENGKWYIRPKKTLTIDLKNVQLLIYEISKGSEGDSLPLLMFYF